MSIKGTVSGSSQPSPTVENNNAAHAPSKITLQEAVLQIQGILELCLNQNAFEGMLPSMAYTDLFFVKEAFNEKFASLLEFNKDDSFSIDDIRGYVSTTLFPALEKIDATLIGKDHMCNKLRQALALWPQTQLYISFNSQNARTIELLEIFPKDNTVLLFNKQSDNTKSTDTAHNHHSLSDNTVHKKRRSRGMF